MNKEMKDGRWKVDLNSCPFVDDVADKDSDECSLGPLVRSEATHRVSASSSSSSPKR